ncbi:MAG: hypothetical protein ACYC6X_02765 [Minisyncoccota bacterium]
MNLRRILSQAALVIGALAFSIGLQAYAQSFAQPTTGPTGGNAQAPLDTGANLNTKQGSLSVNPGGTNPVGLAAGGNIVAAGDICAQNGSLCLSTIGGGGSSLWALSGNDISNTNTGNVNVNSGSCYYKFQNGALHTNCNVTQDIVPSTITFSGSFGGFAGASNHCLETDGSNIYYDAWCGSRTSGPVTISGCTISGSPFYFGNTSDPAGTLTASGNEITFSNGGIWTSSPSTCQLTGSLNIVGGGGGVSIIGNGSTITASGHGSSGTISVVPSGNKNAVWGTGSTAIYQCPSYQESGTYDSGGGPSFVTCPSQCIGQLITSGGSCPYTPFSASQGCVGSASRACGTFVGNLTKP